MKSLQEWFTVRAQALYIRHGFDPVETVVTVLASTLLIGALAMVISHVA